MKVPGEQAKMALSFGGVDADLPPLAADGSQLDVTVGTAHSTGPDGRKLARRRSTAGASIFAHLCLLLVHSLSPPIGQASARRSSFQSRLEAACLI